MSRPRNPNGVRRAHTRNGKPVRATSIKGRQAPKRRLNASAVRRAQHTPFLYGAMTVFGLGAIDAIFMGRHWSAFAMFGLAGAFGIGHLVWRHHQNRKPARQLAAEQRAKARAARQRDAQKYQEATEFSVRGSNRIRAVKEGLRRRYETVRYGKEKATALADARKAELRHGAYWSSDRWGPKPVEHEGIRRTPAKTGYRPVPAVNKRRVKAAAVEEPSDGPPEMLSAPELNRKTTAARGQEVLR